LATQQVTFADPVLIGETGVLKPAGTGATMVLIGVDEKAVDAFYKALTAKDDMGLKELVSAGQLFGADVGARVKVIGLHGFLGSLSEIRILEGTNKGRRGFVSTSLVTNKTDSKKHDDLKSDLPPIFGDDDN
jgi:hypothetical protein